MIFRGALLTAPSLPKYTRHGGGQRALGDGADPPLIVWQRLSAIEYARPDRSTAVTLEITPMTSATAAQI
jgi:hypothetical protein